MSGASPPGGPAVTDLVLGDDHLVFLEALAAVLVAEGLHVVAAENTLAGVLEAVRIHQPDVCLLGSHFADGDGVLAIPDVIGVSPHTRVLVLTADNDPGVMLRALEFGAAGYIHKTLGVAALTDAISRIVQGEVVVNPRKDYRRGVDAAEAHRLAVRLTARERECLGLLVDGLPTGAIAFQLGVSRTTVRSHIQSLLIKLGVHSRLEAVSVAVRYSLVAPRMPTQGEAPPKPSRSSATPS
jgi:two-component system, NarL family, nitrate/nitrite response regulator NarL